MVIMSLHELSTAVILGGDDNVKVFHMSIYSQTCL